MDQLRGDVAYYGELVRQARIISPVSGTVTQKLVNQGEFVSLGAKLVNLVSRDSLFLEAVALLQVSLPQPARAARLYGAAQGLRETFGVPLAPLRQQWQDRVLDTLRETLGPDAFA